MYRKSEILSKTCCTYSINYLIGGCRIIVYNIDRMGLCKIIYELTGENVEPDQEQVLI